MRTKPRALARRAAQALTATAVVTGGVVVAASPAYAAVPLITSVAVAGSTTNKVVTAGTTVLITGSGFSGMTDNAAASSCSVTTIPTGCSQVRFLGVSATATAGFALATRYIVVSDTMIYAAVPTIAASNGITAGAPAQGTGSVKVQVVNTVGAGTSSGLSASATSEVFYRHPLTAALSSAVTANPLGGGTIAVDVINVAPLTATSLPQEKITAYFVSTVDGSPTVTSTSVASIPVGVAPAIDPNTVNVVIPPGTPSGNPVGVMLVHDGIVGEADDDSLSYPALITKLESCTTPATILTWVTTPTGVLPTTCTGPASVSATAETAGVKVTGKGFTGADLWSFDGNGGTIDEDCVVVSDTLAFCHLTIDTVPDPAVAAVTFVPLDPDEDDEDIDAPVLVPTLGSILIFNSLV